MKNSGVGRKPSMTMNLTAAVMNNNTEISAHTQLKKAQAEINSKPTWSQ